MSESGCEQQVDVLVLQPEFTGDVFVCQSPFIRVNALHKPFVRKDHFLDATLLSSPEDRRRKNVA